MELSQENFGEINDSAEVRLFTLKNQHGLIAKITNYGGIVTSLIVPDRNGKPDDVVLGFDTLKGYLGEHPYFGAIIGRYANRIANGRFCLDAVEYKLAMNDGEDHLHGGLIGFDKVVWDAESIEAESGVGVRLHYLSRDTEEGYPGNLDVMVVYMLTNQNELTIDYEAVSDKPCPVNLTHHSYFNLTGGKDNINKHQNKEEEYR